MLVLRLAFRNIFRNRRRSFLTGLMMAGGCALFSTFFGIEDGSYGSIIEMFTRDHTGHVQIHRKGYLEKPSIHASLDDYMALGRKAEAAGHVERWAPRLYAPTLAFAGSKTTGARVVGIDPRLEAETTRIRDKVAEGAYLPDGPSNSVMLSRSLASVLGAAVGDEVALISQAADGSVANDLFVVAGIVGSGDTGFDRMNCYMHLAAAQEFMALQGRVHEIAVVLDDYRRARETAAQIGRAIGDPDISAEPWQVVEEQFYRAMKADVRGTWISIFVFTLILAIGVLNAVLMSMLERTREFGVLKAIGTRPASVAGMIVLESAFLCSMSLIVGIAAGLLANWALSIHGIPIPSPVTYGGVTFERIIAEITLRSVVAPPAIVLSTAVLVSMLPAFRAARIVPVRAIRSG